MNKQSQVITVTNTGSGNPYLHSTPAPPPYSATQGLHSIGRKLESAAKKAENFAGNLYNHLRTGPGVIDVAMTRLDLAARVIADGGCDNFFRKEFGYIAGEKLKKTYACYLSTTGGPVMGTLYISNKRIGFRSDFPVWTGPGGQWVYYKVVMILDQILAVNPSANMGNPMEKYIEVMTKDGHQFWFMGFVFYDEAIKKLNKAIHHFNAY